MCLFPDCETDQILHRGLCKRHYHGYFYSIKTGKTTWDELVSLGLAAKSNYGTKSLYAETIAAARAKAQEKTP